VATTGGLLRAGHASGLHAVSRELAEMRSAVLRTGDEGRMVRLSVLTLVVACADAESADGAAAVVERLAVEHPTRAIIMTADSRAPAGIEADLSLSCSSAKGEQVCAEVVRLSVGGEGAFHLRSVVSPLLLPDVPVHLWLAGAPPMTQALRPDTAELFERLILDSDAYPDPASTLAQLARAVATVDPTPVVGDLAWSRIRGWRELVGRAFDAPDLRSFVTGVEEVEVRSAGTLPSAQARLFAGWLSSRLERPGQLGPHISLVAAGDGGPVGVLTGLSIRARNRDRRAHVEVAGDGGATLRTSVSVEAGTRSTASTWTLAAERPTLVELVGAQLEEQGADPVHTAALLAAPVTVEVR
jgi:glucose-6-phosphate dehydrogenase assembly protein OpcA